MHLNYHFFKFLCPELDKGLKGCTLKNCFSQNKDELIFEFENQEESRFIRALLSPSNTVLSFPDKFARSKKNNIDLFPTLLNHQVTEVGTFLNERAFFIKFESYRMLVFKMHGSRSNVLLFQESKDQPDDIFKKSLQDDWNINSGDFSRPMEFSKERFSTLEGNAAQFAPTLGKLPRQWLKEKGYIEASIEKKWQLMQELLDMLESPIFSIIQEKGDYKLTLLPASSPIFQSSSAIEVSNEFFRYAVVFASFEKEKDKLLKSFQDKIKKTEAYLHKSQQKLKTLVDETSPQQLADIVMANLHQIAVNEEEVTLFDFYQNKNIIVKLKRGMTPQKFAENLYRKGKNRKIEIAQLEENISRKEDYLLELMKKSEEIEAFNSYRDLKAFEKENNLSLQKSASLETIPYKRFEFDSYVVLVGKSAKGNDEMLRYHSWKDDLWLHAKGVSGSHVIIKGKGKENIPKDVLEKSAQLAAYYSKNKNDSLTPVIYTPCKYVRKVKGSAPGAVMVDKEKVIMVSPKGPQELQ
ncbi:NFACT RNA binding domain-containing protein [Litoribacter populi]|uniref:NFACT RNA binding domain-containing protein n=1 Tax=Litoribacter populi TaxID=2598460 RepID=UPI00117C59E0|nr:NFACT RNA binding domain-containing protein [Litoribacter populi]